MSSFKLTPSRMQLAEQYRSHYGVVAEEGAILADFLRPEYWAHVANKLRKHDIIEVLPEDGSFFVELIVIQTGTGFAKVMLLREVGLEQTEAVAESDLTSVVWKGPHRKFCVVRTSDKEILRDNFEDKVSAGTWAREYERTVSA